MASSPSPSIALCDMLEFGSGAMDERNLFCYMLEGAKTEQYSVARSTVRGKPLATSENSQTDSGQDMIPRDKDVKRNMRKTCKIVMDFYVSVLV